MGISQGFRVGHVWKFRMWGGTVVCVRVVFDSV